MKQIFPLVPNSPCPQVLLPMRHAQCPIPKKMLLIYRFWVNNRDI
ncbi:hypothetical protein GXM_04733 [Nostoc sphaeroides CCNUC1]|uniref:Uncharacterized protein n=1 Tax=Nostoc sphaeroides CCNUC1 TaxID=2653204 RepID=A0A5P8W3F8_9NOSO|nr:hypothetical protein GXM_04733 [Nostoc sphaeroides CCNUC1]